MPATDDREPIPAELEIHRTPRRPEFDPTLNIDVEVDRPGQPRNRLVTIGDSVTHGFMSGAIFRTDLSWPAIVAFELGELSEFRRPVYEPPGGPGGIPLDIERALRSFETRFGSKLDWHEIVRAAELASRLPGRHRGLLGAGRRQKRRRPAGSCTTWRSTGGTCATR